MTLEVFRGILSENAKLSFKDFETVDIPRLEKSRKEISAMKDIVKLNLPIDYHDCFVSGSKKFGKVFENTANDYAKANGAYIFPSKKFASTEFDILFRYNLIVYGLESKVNINLDNEKTVIARERLRDREIILRHGIHDEYDTVSKIVVWTKPRVDGIIKIAKRQLKKQELLMGYKDFFSIFGVSVTENEYFSTIIDTWWRDVAPHFSNVVNLTRDLKSSYPRKITIGKKTSATFGDWL